MVGVGVFKYLGSCLVQYFECKIFSYLLRFYGRLINFQILVDFVSTIDFGLFTDLV